MSKQRITKIVDKEAKIQAEKALDQKILNMLKEGRCYRYINKALKVGDARITKIKYENILNN